MATLPSTRPARPAIRSGHGSPDPLAAKEHRIALRIAQCRADRDCRRHSPARPNGPCPGPRSWPGPTKARCRCPGWRKARRRRRAAAFAIGAPGDEGGDPLGAQRAEDVAGRSSRHRADTTGISCSNRISQVSGRTCGASRKPAGRMRPMPGSTRALVMQFFRAKDALFAAGLAACPCHAGHGRGLRARSALGPEVARAFLTLLVTETEDAPR